jgi:hypothetical protein
MHKYIATLLASSILFLFFIITIETQGRKIPSVYSDKYEAIKREDYSTLILGSSHTYYGINPQHFSSKAINAANVSQDFKYDLHILEEAVSHSNNIRAVVLPISMFSLTSSLDNGAESWRKHNYHLFMGFQGRGDEPFDARDYSIFLASPDKIGLIQRSLLRVVKRNTEIEWTPKGWGKGYSSSGNEVILRSTGKSAASRHQRYGSSDEANIKNLNIIASLCQSKGIRLILITPPAYISYRINIDKNRLNNVTEEAERLLSTHNNIVYLNLFDDQRFIAEDFHDADHLSSKGAEKLSLIISHEVDSQESIKGSP